METGIDAFGNVDEGRFFFNQAKNTKKYRYSKLFSNAASVTLKIKTF